MVNDEDICTLVLIVKNDEDLQIGDANVRVTAPSGNPIRYKIKVRAPRSIRVKRVKRYETGITQERFKDS